MNLEELERYQARRTCEKCQYSEPSFNLLWCAIHQKTVSSQETCHAFEQIYDPDLIAKMALEIWRP